MAPPRDFVAPQATNCGPSIPAVLGLDAFVRSANWQFVQRTIRDRVRDARVRHVRDDVVADAELAVLKHVHAGHAVRHWGGFVRAVVRSVVRSHRIKGAITLVDTDIVPVPPRRLSFDDVCTGAKIIPFKGRRERFLANQILAGFSCDELASRNGLSKKELRRVVRSMAAKVWRLRAENLTAFPP